MMPPYPARAAPAAAPTSVSSAGKTIVWLARACNVQPPSTPAAVHVIASGRRAAAREELAGAPEEAAAPPTVARKRATPAMLASTVRLTRLSDIVFPRRVVVRDLVHLELGKGLRTR